MILKILISQFSAKFYQILQFHFSYFLVIFELFDLQGPMNFFRSCRYNTGPISKTESGLEHIFETCIFKRMKFC